VASVTSGVTGNGSASPEDRRWLILLVVAIAQLMVVLDSTIVNIALPSAQHALGFPNSDRQWVVTSYALAFGSLLLVGGRLGDMFNRERVFITGLIGFAVSSAIGGASVSFTMLVAARALQGAFGAVLAPSALGTLVSTFREPRERGRAFGVLTGGTGFIGSHILAELRQHGHVVTAFVRDDAQAASVAAAGATPAVVDLYDRPAVTSIFSNADGAIHAASPGDATSADLDSTVADAAIGAFSGTGKPYLHISGDWIYGDNLDITEESPINAPAMVAWKEPIERRVLDAPDMRGG
jgi:Major Facilitator Superfamily/NAD(P)H-binding